MATFRFAFNCGTTAPGNEISSATHLGQPYHFLKFCPTASAGCTTPRRPRTPRHGYPASCLGPGSHSHFSATKWARGRAIQLPPRAAATGTRRDTRAAPGPVASGDRVRARGWVTGLIPGGSRRPQVRPAPQAGRGGDGARPRPSSHDGR